jgi:hypothetical protein
LRKLFFPDWRHRKIIANVEISWLIHDERWGLNYERYSGIEIFSGITRVFWNKSDILE